MPGSLLAQRAMMILACVFGTFGLIGALASTDMVNAGMTFFYNFSDNHVYTIECF